MNKFGPVIVAIVASVVLSSFAVVFGATAAVQDFLGISSSSSSSSSTDRTSTDALKAVADRLAKLEAADGQSTPVAVDGKDWSTQITALHTENDALRADNARLSNELAALREVVENLKTQPGVVASASGDDVPAGVPLTPEQNAALRAHLEAQVASAMRDTASQVFDQKREEERQARRAEEDLRRQEEVRQSLESAEERVGRMMGFLGQALELDELQSTAVQAALVDFEKARVNIGYQAWKEEWDRETTQKAYENQWASTKNAIAAAGLSDEQMERMDGMANRMTRGMGGPGGFNRGGGPQGGPQGGFNGRGGR